MNNSLNELLIGMTKNEWEAFKQEVDRKFNEKSSQNTLGRENLETVEKNLKRWV